MRQQEGVKEDVVTSLPLVIESCTGALEARGPYTPFAVDFSLDRVRFPTGVPYGRTV